MAPPQTSPWQTIPATVWDWLAHTVDWGNAQEFITWVVAGFALVYAARASSAARRTDERQAQQLKAIHDDKRKAQAEKVAGWYVRRTETGASAAFGNSPVVVIPSVYDAFAMRNASDVPVYNIAAWASGADLKEMWLAIEFLDVLPPGETVHQSIDLPEGTDREKVKPRVSMLFRDAAGEHWYRRHDGILKEVPAGRWNGMYQAVLLREDAEFRKRDRQDTTDAAVT